MLRKWKECSIQYKLIALYVVFVLPMVILIGVLAAGFYSYHIQSSSIMSQYSDALSCLSAFQQEHQQAQVFLYTPVDNENLYAYDKSVHQTTASFASLVRTNSYDQTDTAELKHALQQSLSSYRTAQDGFYDALLRNGFDQESFQTMNLQALYIERYAQDLTYSLLLHGQSTYLILGQEMAEQNSLFLRGALVALFGLFFGTISLVRNFASPVRELTRHAQRLAQGDYATLPMTQRQDELGELSRAFASMQQQVQRNIHALEAEAELEKSLRLHQAEESRLQKLVDESRFAQLQSQINPHFLFNTLQTISTMAELEHATVSNDMIVRLSKFFRYSLETDDSLVTLGRELDLLRDYISLQEVRFEDRLRFEMHCEDGCSHLSIPKFTLQPLVENALKHGLRHKASGGHIRITVRRQGQGCIIWVTDNGCGFSVPALKSKTPHQEGRSSIGLRNIAKRLELNGSTFYMTSIPGMGTSARIQLKGDTHA